MTKEDKDTGIGRTIAADKLDGLMPEKKKPETRSYGYDGDGYGGGYGGGYYGGGYYDSGIKRGRSERYWDGDRWRWRDADEKSVGRKPKAQPQQQPSLWDDDYNKRTNYGRRTSIADGDDDVEVPAFMRRDRSGQRPTTSAGPSHERTAERTTVTVMRYGKVETPVKITEGVGCTNVAYVARDDYEKMLTALQRDVADALESKGLVWTTETSKNCRAMMRELVKGCMLKQQGPTVTQYYAIEVVDDDGVVLDPELNDPINF